MRMTTARHISQLSCQRGQVDERREQCEFTHSAETQFNSTKSIHALFRMRLKVSVRQLLLSGTLLLSLASCINEYDDEITGNTDGTVSVELSIQTRSIGSISGDSREYVPGTEWENYVDIAGGDYRIYFFEYDPTTETAAGRGKNSTLIAEFKPNEVYATEQSTYTTYTMSGEMDESIITSLTNFKVVVVANWRTYPTVTAGTTTIDDICNTGTFSAFVQSGAATMPSSTLHIPFFGLREYSNVQWRENSKTTLSGDITLLRAVAKVEVILDVENSDMESLESVSIVSYNQSGYCAPTNVYLREDYDHDYNWSEDFMDWLHLTNGSNDMGSTSMTMAMQRTETTATQETWTCYLTEYDNTSNANSTGPGRTNDDYSYIQVTVDGQTFPIYFGNYEEDGTCAAYDSGGDTDDRYDIYRNYLYRFLVTYVNEELVLMVTVNAWEASFENSFEYGDELP